MIHTASQRPMRGPCAAALEEEEVDVISESAARTPRSACSIAARVSAAHKLASQPASQKAREKTTDSFRGAAADGSSRTKKKQHETGKPPNKKTKQEQNQTRTKAGETKLNCSKTRGVGWKSERGEGHTGDGSGKFVSS